MELGGPNPVAGAVIRMAPRNEPHSRHQGACKGGAINPLNPSDLPKIDAAVRSILVDVGMAEAPEVVIEPVTRAGGSLDADGRLHFTAELIDNALARDVCAIFLYAGRTRPWICR